MAPMSSSGQDPTPTPGDGSEANTEISEPKTEVKEPATKVQEPASAARSAADDPSVEDAAKLPRGRRYAVRTLLVLGTVIGIVAILAVWVNRQALNADNWATTSSSLLQNKDVRDQVSLYVVDQIYANVDVAGEIESALPKQLKPLAGEAAGGLQNLAGQGVDELLSRPFIQEAWKESNRLAMQQFINVVEEKQGGLVESSKGDIVINLRPLITAAVDKLGLPANLANQIPADAGAIKVFSSDDVAAVQSYAKVLRGLGLILPILTFLLFALAIFLARGRRRKTLIVVGVDLIVIGAIVLVIAVVAGNQVVDALSSTESVKPAVRAIWEIATQMLRDIAWATILTSIPLILAALLAGPSQPAVSSRKALAPWLRHQLGLAYGVVGVLVVLLIVWAPLHWMQQPIPVLVMIGLVVLGVEILRRQTAREFPDAQIPDAGAAISSYAKRMTEGAKDAGRKGQEAVSGAVASRKSDDAAEAPTEVSSAAAGVAAAATAAPPAPAAGDDKIERLERLASLHDRGHLSDEEFAAEKAKILGA